MSRKFIKSIYIPKILCICSLQLNKTFMTWYTNIKILKTYYTSDADIRSIWVIVTTFYTRVEYSLYIIVTSLLRFFYWSIFTCIKRCSIIVSNINNEYNMYKQTILITARREVVILYDSYNYYVVYLILFTAVYQL